MGFDKHIDVYKNGLESAAFVSFLANHLKLHSDQIVLEPRLENEKNRSDILFIKGNEYIYFECKQPIQEKDYYYEEGSGPLWLDRKRGKLRWIQ